MYMSFVLMCVLGLDYWQCDCKNIAFAFGPFFERLLILLPSSMSPCFLVDHLPSRPIMKSSIMPVANFFPLREIYACKVCSLYTAANMQFLMKKSQLFLCLFLTFIPSSIFTEWDCASYQMLWLFTELIFPVMLHGATRIFGRSVFLSDVPDY